MAGQRRLRAPLGEPLKIYPEVLIPEQQRVLASSAPLVELWGAYLAGGAGLALQLGHRRSRDFDWFTPNTLPPANLLEALHSLKLPVDVRQNTEGTFHAHVGGVEYSVFRYHYRLVSRPVLFNGCQLASLRDIAAMKMAAIVGRAVKRDYVDLHVLFNLGKLQLSDAVAAMRRKFPGVDTSLSLRALTHFADVEKQPMPEMLISLSWDDVKRGLSAIRERGLRRGLDR